MDEKQKQSNTKRIAIIVIILLAVGCGWYWYKGMQVKKMQAMAAARAAMATPMVVLGEVAEANLSTEKEYVGSVEPIQTVNVVPSIVGKIAAVNFKEGSSVRAGQVLFTIEQNDYKATVELRKAQLAQARANLANAESYLERIKAADPRSISGADVDKAKAAYHGAKAGVASAEASLQLARIDLERTCVRSPITGRAGKALFTKGNYVTPQGSPLAVIVQDDPVRVTFSMPDRDYLDRLKEFEAEGAVFDTKLRLSNGDIIEATGQRDFENNTVDRKTGTIAVRLRYENKNGLLIPGSLVRVITKPVATRLVRYIPQEAVLADAQGDYVYTVNAQNKAVMKRVHLGDEYGSSRFVESGLEKGDKIVVQGIQMLRPGIAVKVVENQKNMDTAAEQAKQSDFDLAPDKDGKKDTKDVKDAKADIKAAKEEPQGKKVPAAMPPVKQQGK